MPDDTIIRVLWDGARLVPDGNHATAVLHDRFGAGEVTFIDLDPKRSLKSHNHQFAFVKTAWDNLPESMKDAPFAKTPDTLRKHALCRTGWCDTSMVAVGDPNRAERIAAIMDRMARALNGYAITEASGPVVYCFTPKSQSERAMGKEAFQKSKQDILNWLADLIGVHPDDLARMGKREPA